MERKEIYKKSIIFALFAVIVCTGFASALTDISLIDFTGAIDKIEIESQNGSVLNTNQIMCGNYYTLIVKVRNSGTTTKDVTVNYNIDGLTLSPKEIYSISPSDSRLRTKVVNFTLPSGFYDIEITADVGGDSNLANNVATRRVEVVCSASSGESCGNRVIKNVEECDDGNKINGDGCSSTCKIEIGRKVYIAPYVGDIDGAVNEDWFVFYRNITDFHNKEKIPTTFSFYPATMIEDPVLESIFKDIYLGNYIELTQKGYNGDSREMRMDELTFDEQKAIIKAGQDAFRTRMMDILGSNSVKVPTTYNQIGARFTDVTLKASKELGFNIYLDLYTGDGLTPVQPTNDYDTLQYGVSFSKTGGAGAEETYKTTPEILMDIRDFDRGDVPIKKINGTDVIPIWVHQQDFETPDGKLNITKWNIYQTTLKRLRDDPNVVLIRPSEIYLWTHPDSSGNTGNNTNGSSQFLCQYASSAKATSENSQGSFASYAIGAPDATQDGCAVWSGYGHSWSTSNWNVRANLTLTYNTPVYVNNLTIFSDYDSCWNGIWLENSQTGEKLNILNGIDETCKLTKQYTGDFKADKIILQSCGWSWSSTDAVQLCGTTAGTVTRMQCDDGIDNDLDGSVDMIDPGCDSKSDNDEFNIHPEIKPSNVTVCNWKGCKKGSVSISVDDYYNSCMTELEANGYRGTYYLSNTNTYTSTQWKTFNDAFLRGHEIGSHTQDHWCIEQTPQNYIKDIQDNINDITSHTSVKQTDLISHAYPCGFNTPGMQNILKTNWNFLSARGYNFNQVDNLTLNNFLELKNYNSYGYPGGRLDPPNYETVADKVENEGKWANIVFHNECYDDNVIDYLPTKNVWVDTVGNVVKYIKLRDSAKIYEYEETRSLITFRVKADDSMKSIVYNQNITLQVPVKSGRITRVEINGANSQFKWFASTQGGFAQFDVPFPIDKQVIITRT